MHKVWRDGGAPSGRVLVEEIQPRTTRRGRDAIRRTCGSPQGVIRSSTTTQAATMASSPRMGWPADYEAAAGERASLDSAAGVCGP